MTGYDGVVATGFVNSSTGKTEFVGQTMRLGSSPRALVIYGYNPVVPDTNRPHPTYSPDNFAFQIHPVHGFKAVTIDDAYNRSPVPIKPCHQ
ncbi:hypothetical protein [Acaryochloris sp. IP29b_bin.137]|uniref:hypothetical protein n=1 Tax=Acaryochloris sp. IP29b_bin.137 TaxID=2969217 RepID=UPI00262EB440|nr:hypothetical protein [Acaryochloris sp. IP29b_bin.137]